MTIAAEVKRGLESAQKYCGPDPTSLDERDLECLRALRLTNPRDDKIRIQQEKGGLLEGSYSWVLDNDNFRQWRDNQENRLLWINGDPGKGKTMLLCGIIDELVKSATHTTNVSFFFCQATNGDINDATAVLRGLLYLFVKQQPSLISQVRETYDDSGKKCFEGPNAWVALSKMFTSILKDERLHDTYLIIDALDECVTGLSLLLTLIVQESAAYSNVKWIVSSRNWPSIEKDLNTATQKATLCLELNEKSVSRAVAAYVRFKVDQLAARNKYRPGTRDAVERYLSLHAYGTFLWVALVCHELRDVSWDVQRKLKAFPPGLDALYQRMVRQICGSEHAELCKNILAVISAVRRPITLDELETFVDMPEEASASYEVLAEIIGHCGSFLTLQERTISFVHQSAKDFLVQEASKNSLSRIQDPRIQDSWIKDSWIQDAHRSIFLRSLQVMTDTLRRDIYNLYAPGFPIGKVELPTPDPLAAARYSCVYWIDHLDDCSADDQKKYLQEKGPVDTFLQQKYLYWLEALSLLRSVSNGVLAMARLEGLLQASALIFSPAGSRIRRLFQTEEPKWMITKPLMENEWSACLSTLEGHSDSVHSVAWSYDATRLVSGSRDNTVKIWDPATGQCLSTLEGHCDLVHSVAWSYDTTRLASGSRDNTVKIWDPATGQCLSTLEGHSHPVHSVAWSYDATRLASGSWDNTVKIWDPATGQCLSTLEGHSDCLTAFLSQTCSIWLKERNLDYI
ncbi:hypothetical protein B0T24DRAFT_645076 [Lasiosphaeria ovina]|uniref:NACHT domain-containing protein n=1 Tax=Lasiosphaeria ovina TaxID=92902 RepID=A0AAE0TWP3_9PEZI|nr:hypothetical protein B0T24DRAFT_645076 [Lasiosphaeria ovina]